MLDYDRSQVVASLLVSGWLAAFVVAPVAWAQAAAEYALQSSRGALSASGTDAAIAGCSVDASLLTCLSRSYPKTTIVVASLLTLAILRWLTRMYRARA